MSKRNLNVYQYFKKLSENHRPRRAFEGKSKKDFSAWQKELLPRVIDTMGNRPSSVDPNPELVVEWEEDGLLKQRWLIDVQEHLSAALLVFRPAKMKKNEKRPAILCNHGHSEFGKNPVMGLDSYPHYKTPIEIHNYDYGRQMAKAGFVTYAIDFMGFGERDPRRKPHSDAHIGYERRDPCNVHYLCATMLGSTVLASNTHDASAATDFVCTLPFVDKENLGVMGLSFGGTMTTWMALTDERFKAADVMGYGGPFHAMAFETYNACGSQITPGLYALCDMADLQGLIAPRPLLFEAGIHDSCFEVDPVMGSHYPQLEKIYDAAGAKDKLWLDLFPGEHAWGGNKSEAFFRKYLNFKKK